jgi:hypothetical protein
VEFEVIKVLGNLVIVVFAGCVGTVDAVNLV